MKLGWEAMGSGVMYKGSPYINHWDINVLAFHNDWDTNYIINIYSDSNQTALRALRESMTNIDKTIILTGDFNIRDSDWDPNFRHHSSHTDNLITIADSLGLELSPPQTLAPLGLQTTHAILTLS